MKCKQDRNEGRLDLRQVTATFIVTKNYTATVLWKSQEPPIIYLYSAQKIENRCCNLLKHVQNIHEHTVYDKLEVEWVILQCKPPKTWTQIKNAEERKI